MLLHKHMILEQVDARLKTEVIGRASDYANELWDEIDSTNARVQCSPLLVHPKV